MAQPFDATRLELNGDAIAIADDVHISDSLLGLFSASQNGTLALQTGAEKLIQPAWVDRSGKVLDVIGDPAAFQIFRVSPNGEKVAFVVRDPQDGTLSIWIYDSSGQHKTRLTFSPYSAQWPTWSADSSRIVFQSDLKGPGHLFSIPATGTGLAEPIFSTDRSLVSNSWSSDGRFLALLQRTFSGKSSWNIWILPMFGDHKPFQLLHSNFGQWDVVFSPDGKWLAYQSDESGRDEIYVVPFPVADTKLVVSTGGGRNPQWSSDGKELYYLVPDGSLAAVSLQSERNGLRASASQTLFKTNSLFFDVSHDGKRFLILRDAESQQIAPITLITNWPAALKK